MKVLVSGATGWMGQSFCREVNQGSFPFNLMDLIALTSRQKISNQESGVTFEDFWKLPQNTETEGFVHLAFITRDKVSQMSLEDYVTTNRKIIRQAIELIQNKKPKWVALISSGAVYSKESGFTEPEVALETNPYGFLKLEEERLITEITTEIGANLAIGRLWGATGRDLPPDPKYAISDFITTAMGSKSIHINSQNEVYRRYCDAGEFMNVLVRTAMGNSLSVFNSGGVTVELADLANEIALQIGECKITRDLIPGKSPDLYYPKDQSYENLAKSLGLSVLGLKDQVSRTILGHADAK